MNNSPLSSLVHHAKPIMNMISVHKCSQFIRNQPKNPTWPFASIFQSLTIETSNSVPHSTNPNSTTHKNASSTYTLTMVPNYRQPLWSNPCSVQMLTYVYLIFVVTATQKAIQSPLESNNHKIFTLYWKNWRKDSTNSISHFGEDPWVPSRVSSISRKLVNTNIMK